MSVKLNQTPLCPVLGHIRQAGSLLCDAAAKPANRRPCGLTACALTARQLRLSFTPWAACEADCSDGFNGRSAICADADGVAADVAACTGYNGVPAPNPPSKHQDHGWGMVA